MTKSPKSQNPRGSLLKRINSPADLRKLNIMQLRRLCAEARWFLIDNLSKTGGHFASNMGAVELITAIDYVFDMEKDYLVFDVGHQCYTHKLYTGRRELFGTLRKKDGLSGFPKPSEGKYDPFIAGHGSTSVSVALGLARASRLKGEKRHVIALIGDGAMTGGIAYEGLNDAGGSGTPMIVVLNDNGMSIAKSVGGLARSLTRFRVRKRYRVAKETYHELISKIPGGARVNRVLSSLKNSVKHAIIPETFFEDMGFEYIGPVDGHDLGELIRIFSSVKDYRRPVLVHVITQKGKGYAFSEREPEKFHGIGCFDIKTGQPLSNCWAKTFTAAFSDALCELARTDDRIVAITAAMPQGAGLDEFQKRFPSRYFDVGIAEEHAVTMAAGMARGGLKPFVAIYSTFLQRSFDQIMHDVGIMSLPVVFCIDRAGLVGEDGETHQGLYDLGMLWQVPGMCVYMPSNHEELAFMMRAAAAAELPTAIRYTRGAPAGFDRNTADMAVCQLVEGSDITLLSCGRLIDNTLSAAELLRSEGISAGVVKLNRVKPLPLDELRKYLGKTVLFCEETSLAGSAGVHLAAALRGEGYKIELQNCGDRYIPQAAVAEQMDMCGLTAEKIAKRARGIVRG